jgi:hypothetical protein
MARAPIVEIESNELPNVLEVEWTFENATDADNVPTNWFLRHGIRIRRKLDDNDLLADWAGNADGFNRKRGLITYRNADGTLMRCMGFEEAFVRDYDVEFNSASGHLEEIIAIEARHYFVNGDDSFTKSEDTCFAVYDDGLLRRGE